MKKIRLHRTLASIGLLLLLTLDVLGQNCEQIFFVANKETMGDGKNPASMDCFLGEQYPYLSLIIPFLEKKGISVEVLDWEDNGIDFTNKKLIIGPVWGYTNNLGSFIQWIHKLEREKVEVWNSARFIEWNLFKTYLIDLAEAGFNIPSTTIISSNSNICLDDAIALHKKNFRSNDLIMKGVVDAGGFGYKHLHKVNEEDFKKHFEKLKSSNYGVIIQDFIPEIYKKGELSFVFYAGNLSHAFLKLPKYHEERVQPFYGGKSFHINFSDIEATIKKIQLEFRNDIEINFNEIISAKRLVKKIYNSFSFYLRDLEIQQPLYLRIDGTMVDDSFMIMEIEGIEPYMEIKEAMFTDPTNDVLENYYLGLKSKIFEKQSTN